MSNNEQLKKQRLQKVLIGRQIVSAGSDQLVLDNGAVISFEEYGECCAWAMVAALATTDHVITDVTVNEETIAGAYDTEQQQQLTFHALSGGSEKTEFLRVVGDEGTGYYLYGVRVVLDGVKMHDITFSN